MTTMTPMMTLVPRWKLLQQNHLTAQPRGCCGRALNPSAACHIFHVAPENGRFEDGLVILRQMPFYCCVSKALEPCARSLRSNRVRESSLCCAQKMGQIRDTVWSWCCFIVVHLASRSHLASLLFPSSKLRSNTAPMPDAMPNPQSFGDQSDCLLNGSWQTHHSRALR